MTEPVPVLIVTIPLAAAVLVPLVALRSVRLARGVMFLALAISTLFRLGAGPRYPDRSMTL